MRYRRSTTPGATYFFTVNLFDRRSDLLQRHANDLRTVMRSVKAEHPFSVLAMVILPEHLHAIWRLPPDDANYPLRWSLIKSGFSRRIPRDETVRASRQAKRERGLWQRRYWEHQIRDEQDLARHVDYVHYNPVKHGWVKRAADWPHSTIHEYIRQGRLPPDWGGPDAGEGDYGER
jgi:putative transposase